MHGGETQAIRRAICLPWRGLISRKRTVGSDPASHRIYLGRFLYAIGIAWQVTDSAGRMEGCGMAALVLSCNTLWLVGMLIAPDTMAMAAKP